MHGFPDVLGGLVRLVTWDLAWTGALRQLGRGVLLVLTLGRFPRGRQLERHGDLVACAGLLTLIAAWGAIALWNQRAQVPPRRDVAALAPGGLRPLE
jgi:hypothetical protein